MRGKYKTDCEIVMEDSLKLEGIDYAYDYPPRCKYDYRYDFALFGEDGTNLKIDIECDGEHVHPVGNSHDKKRDGFTKSRGWIILRFSRQQILNNIQSCINKINETIERRLKEYGKAS